MKGGGVSSLIYTHTHTSHETKIIVYSVIIIKKKKERDIPLSKL